MSNQKLIEGFKAFRQDAYEGECTLMQHLVEKGQDPDLFIISCIDSRGNPGSIFRPEPGTFFAHKAMGAIVRPYKKGTALAAALQFALKYSGVTTIIVLGHTGCGAVKALVEGLDDEEISEFTNVVHHCAGDSYEDSEKCIILQSVENLKRYPSVARALEENRVTIKPWLFDMEAGDILEHDYDSGTFQSLI